MDIASSDIDTGAHLAARIYQYGFLEENPADVRYKNFQNDIFNLHCLLDKIHDALQNAQQRYLDRGRAHATLVYQPLSENFEKERKSFVGDFVATLQVCDSLLEENKKIRLRYGDDLENLSARVAQQEQRVVHLRGRLHLHCEKIRLAIDRLSVDLLTDQDANVTSVVAVAQRNLEASIEILPDLDSQFSGSRSQRGTPPERLHDVTSAIASKFQEQMLVDAPPGIESGLPLPQAFDALLKSFQQSVSGSDQTHEKYLLFLKARWILSQIKASKDYQMVCPAFYYKRALHQIEQAILTRIRQPGDLISYDERVLMTVPSFAFRIWPPPAPILAPQTIMPHPLVARANEQKVVTINLASDNPTDPDTVTVFRSSDTQFRIVVKSSLDPGLGGKSFIPQTVYCVEDKLIPRYALPTLLNGSPELAIFSRNEEMLYKFESFRDLYTFQAALTGYDVSHDQCNIRCQFSDDVSSLDCVGRLQLWQEPILLSPGTNANDLSQLRSLRTQNSFVEGTLSRRDSVIPSSVAPSNTVSWTAGGWEAENIKLPTITIFTQLVDKRGRTRFAIIYIPLERGIYVDPTECACCRQYETCSKLVLTHEKKRDFGVRVHYSSEADGTGQPNPNTFDIFPFRLPRHPGFRQMKSKQTQYLVLKFRSLPEKQTFHRELDLRFRVRDKQITDQRDFTNRVRHRQNRPQGRRNMVVDNSSYLSSLSEVSFEASMPPILDVPDYGPALVDTIANGTASTSSRSAASNVPLSPVAPTPQSMSSVRRAASLCNSLDSMVLATSDVDRIDRYLVGDAKTVLTPDTCSSVYSAADVITPLQSSKAFDAVPNDVTNALQKHKEFYAPDIQVIPGLSRSPSSLAPERYDPDVADMKIQEPTIYNATSLRNRSFPSPGMRTAITPGEKIHEMTNPAYTSQVPRTQSAAAPEWYSPESIAAHNVHNRQSNHRDTKTPMATIKDERLGLQAESNISRSKTGRRKTNFFSSFRKNVAA